MSRRRDRPVRRRRRARGRRISAPSPQPSVRVDGATAIRERPTAARMAAWTGQARSRRDHRAIVVRSASRDDGPSVAARRSDGTAARAPRPEMDGSPPRFAEDGGARSRREAGGRRTDHPDVWRHRRSRVGRRSESVRGAQPRRMASAGCVGQRSSALRGSCPRSGDPRHSRLTASSSRAGCQDSRLWKAHGRRGPRQVACPVRVHSGRRRGRPSPSTPRAVQSWLAAMLCAVCDN